VESLPPASHVVDDLVKSVDRYDTVLRKLLDSHAPMKERTVILRTNAPWYDDNLREAKQLKRRLERKMVKTGKKSDKDAFVKQCKTYRRMLVEAKCNHHRKEVANCNDRQLFNFVKRMSSPSSQTYVLPDFESEGDLANDFVRFFHNKIRDLRNKLDNIVPPSISVDINDRCRSSFSSFNPVTEDDIRRLISQSTSASCSLDPIPTSLLKSCSDAVLPHITHIVNKSLSSGVIPDSLKSAQVKPLLKKPGLDRNDYKNYRPISNLKFLFKTIEKAAACQVKDYLDANGLHDAKQSAYRKFHSTETALVRIQNDLLRAVDRHQEAILVLIDYSAAFDTIDHRIILRRLQNRYGIVGTSLKWFKSYLMGRVQSVDIGGTLSDPFVLKEGVPQGSVFGPTIFTMYFAPIGDIINAHGVKYMKFADDSQLYLIFEPSERPDALSKIQECISDVRSWSVGDKLMFNDSKTEVIHITSKFVHSPPFPKVSIGDSLIDISCSAKNLGVIFNHTLDMKDHVKAIVKAASFAIYKIGQLTKYLDRKSIERLVHAFVSSRLDSCNSLLYGIPEKEIKQLQRVQNAAARLVTGTKKYDHISPVLKDLHWLPVRHRITYKIALMTFKSLHGMAPGYITELISRHKPSRTLRSSSAHLLKRPDIQKTITYGESSFTFAAPTIWNDLPADIRSITSLENFKRRLKTHLFKM